MNVNAPATAPSNAMNISMGSNVRMLRSGRVVPTSLPSAANVAAAKAARQAAWNAQKASRKATLAAMKQARAAAKQAAMEARTAAEAAAAQARLQKTNDDIMSALTDLMGRASVEEKKQVVEEARAGAADPEFDAVLARFAGMGVGGARRRSTRQQRRRQQKSRRRQKSRRQQRK